MRRHPAISGRECALANSQNEEFWGGALAAAQGRSAHRHVSPVLNYQASTEVTHLDRDDAGCVCVVQHTNHHEVHLRTRAPTTVCASV
jgi:hypothetical protein